MKQGETIEVTDRGEPVALLTPLAETAKPKSRRDEMIAAGTLIPGTQDWSDFVPLRLPPGGPPLSEILEELREDRV